MSNQSDYEAWVEEVWRTYLTTGNIKHVDMPLFSPKSLQRLMGRLPAEPRCRLCQAPFHGLAVRWCGSSWIEGGQGSTHRIAFTGAVGSEESVVDIVALGDAVNIAAHLDWQTGRGEVLVSAATCEAAGLDTNQLETRRLQLKSRTEQVNAFVLHVRPSSQAA